MLSGYSKEELQTFQCQDPVINFFEQFWDRGSQASSHKGNNLPIVIVETMGTQ